MQDDDEWQTVPTPNLNHLANLQHEHRTKGVYLKANFAIPPGVQYSRRGKAIVPMSHRNQISWVGTAIHEA